MAHRAVGSRLLGVVYIVGARRTRLVRSILEPELGAQTALPAFLDIGGVVAQNLTGSGALAARRGGREACG